MISPTASSICNMLHEARCSLYKEPLLPLLQFQLTWVPGDIENFCEQDTADTKDQVWSKRMGHYCVRPSCILLYFLLQGNITNTSEVFCCIHYNDSLFNSCFFVSVAVGAAAANPIITVAIVVITVAAAAAAFVVVVMLSQ